MRYRLYMLRDRWATWRLDRYYKKHPDVAAYDSRNLGSHGYDR